MRDKGLLLLTALALAAGGCKKDANKQPEVTASLWALAPADATAGIVVERGAGSRGAAALQEIARVLSAYPATSAWLLAQRSALFPGAFDPFDRNSFALLGLDPDGEFAIFGNGPVPSLIILSLADRNRFRSYTDMTTSRRGGREVDSDGHMTCTEFADRYACSTSLEALDAAMTADAPAGFGARVPELAPDLRGDIELAFRPGARGPTGAPLRFPDELIGADLLFISYRLVGERATLRMHMAGKPGPDLQAWRTLEPSEAVADLSRGAVGVSRFGFDPAGVDDALPDDPRVAGLYRMLLDNLDGEVVLITKGSGAAAGQVALGVKDVDAARALIPMVCALAASRILPDASMRAGACEATLSLPEVPGAGAALAAAFAGAPLSLAIVDDMLVLSLGHTMTGRTVSTPELPAGAWSAAVSLRSLDPLATIPEVSQLFMQAVAADFGPEAASAVNALRWVLAHIAELTAGLRIEPDGVTVFLSLVTYGDDPPEVRERYEAAVRKLLAGDGLGYLTDLEPITEHPETRAGRQARLVGDRAPAFGPGVMVLGAAWLAGQEQAPPDGSLPIIEAYGDPGSPDTPPSYGREGDPDLGD